MVLDFRQKAYLINKPDRVRQTHFQCGNRLDPLYHLLTGDENPVPLLELLFQPVIGKVVVKA
jgi:hypothetical protein